MGLPLFAISLLAGSCSLLIPGPSFTNILLPFPLLASSLIQKTPDNVLPILFVSRNPIKDADGLALPGFGPGHRTAAVGGKLMIRGADGNLSTLVGPESMFDVADPCVSWDGKRVAFSGLEHRDSSWRIYEIGVDGTELKKLTFTNRTTDLSQFGRAAGGFERYDDFDPCYLPDGRIVCASTRFPSLASYDRLLTSNLFVIASDGLMRRITTERNGGEEPTIDPVTGRIVYARWWANRDLPSNKARNGVTRDRSLALTDDVANIWHAISIRSDGEGMKLYAGFPRTRAGTQTYKPSIMKDGRLLSVFSPNTSLTDDLGGLGIRWFNPGVDFEHDIAGVSSSQHPAEISSPFATDGVQFNGDSILMAYAERGDDFGIYSAGLDGSNVRRLVDLPGTHELEPQVIRSQEIPPVLEEEFPYPTLDLPPTEDPRTYLRNDTFRFDCMNIFTNGPVDSPMPDAPRITTGARIRFFMNVQRQNPDDPDPAIFLKDAEVFLTGGVHEHDVPADVPLFEQVVDANGDVLTSSDGNFAHVTGMNFDRMGSGTKCVGCHAGHTVIPVPINGSVAEWINVSPSASVTASSAWRSSDAQGNPARHIVDRRAKTGGIDANWITERNEEAWIDLKWEIPIEVREFLLYGITVNREEGTTIAVHNCEIMLYYKDDLVYQVKSTGEVRPSGTRVVLPPTDIDSVRFIIREFTGTIRGRSVSGLAEVETIARISRLNYQ